MLALYTENLSGNLHNAALTINKLGLAKYVLVMDYSAEHTVVVFRMPAERVVELREASRGFVGNHDDLKGLLDTPIPI